MLVPNLIGQQIHHYEILSHLGGGGMGVVYKAKDTKLGRTVALKFLAPQLTSDPELKKRFVQEAKAASALDHPNIGTIFEINETDDGQLFIAMAYYEGETLKDKIAQGPIPTEQAIDYAVQIAKGLAKAHEADIVHRDIKPANILITKDNTVKIVDFGLAKMTGETQLTKTGSTIGTIAYMSPEQLKGEEVDHRTDIWSLGVVLYEMVVGKRPFGGEYEHAVIYGILHDEMELGNLPVELHTVVRGALQKERIKRFNGALELWGQSSPNASKNQHMVQRSPRLSNWFYTMSLGALLVVVAILVAFLVQKEQPAVENPSPTELVHTKLSFSGGAYGPTLSPDGELVAYLQISFDESSFEVYLQEVSGSVPIEVFTATTSVNFHRGLPYIRWSPDGSLLGLSYWDEDNPQNGYQFLLFSKLGKLIRTVTLPGQTLPMFSWSPGGNQIAYMSEKSIRTLDVSTFDEHVIQIESDADLLLINDWSPSGRFFLLRASTTGQVTLWIVEGDTGYKQELITTEDRIPHALWGEEDESIYFMKRDYLGVNEAELWKVEISTQSGKPVTEPQRIVHELKYSFGFSISPATNQLAYFSDEGYVQLWGHSLEGNSLEGKGSNLTTRQLTSLTSAKASPSISPDGKEVAFMMEGVSGHDVYTISMDGSGEMVQRTFVGNADMDWKGKVDWNRDGDKIAFVSREGVRLQRINVLDVNSGQVIPLSEGGVWSVAWGNADEILYADKHTLRVTNVATMEDTVLIDISGAKNIHYPALSPDGNYIAYHALMEEGVQEIWIYSLDEQTNRRIYTATIESGAMAHTSWSEDGRFIYAHREVSLNPPDSMAILKIDVDTGAISEHATLPGFSMLDISSSGSQFATLKWELTSDIYLIENFDPEVE